MTQQYDSTKDTEEHIDKVRSYLHLCSSMLHSRASTHDESKLGKEEKPAFDKSHGMKSMVYGSPEYQQALKDLGPALKHHYEHNSHHPEHYPNGIEGMSLFDLLEMLMDWKAASERMKDGGNIWRSLALNSERFHMNTVLFSILSNTIKEMKWE